MINVVDLTMKQHRETVVPTKPPLERLATMAEPAELARFRASPKTPADRVRIGEHMLRRNPDWIRPYLLLAENAPSPFVRNVYLAQAVRVGRRVWGPWLKGAEPIAWWTDEETQPFMTALAMYGVEMTHKGTISMAKGCLRLLLELDPADQIGAVDLFTEAKLIHTDNGHSKSGKMM